MLGAQLTPIYYVSLLVLVTGRTVGSQLPMAAAVNNWFRRRRATAMGVMLLPSVAAFLFIPPLHVATALLGTVDARVAWLGAAVVMLALVWPLWKLVRNRPEDHGHLPDGIDLGRVVEGVSDQSDNAVVIPDYTWRESLGTRTFWMMTLGVGFNSSVSAGVIFFVPLLLSYRGLSPLESGWVLAVLVLVSLVSSVVGGMIGDRFPIRWVMLACSLIQVIATGMLVFVQTVPMAFLFAAIMGTGSGGSLPLALAARGVYFGRRNFGIITGISMVGVSVMQFFVPITLGLVFDFQQSFPMLPVTTMVIGSAGCIFFLLLGEPRPSPSQSRPVEATQLMA